MDEITVSSSRSRHTDRFVCRNCLGCKGGERAGFLTPVPADSVVYGSGENAVILSRVNISASPDTLAPVNPRGGLTPI